MIIDFDFDWYVTQSLIGHVDVMFYVHIANHVEVEVKMLLPPTGLRHHQRKKNLRFHMRTERQHVIRCMSRQSTSPVTVQVMVARPTVRTPRIVETASTSTPGLTQTERPCCQSFETQTSAAQTTISRQPSDHRVPPVATVRRILGADSCS